MRRGKRTLSYRAILLMVATLVLLLDIVLAAPTGRAAKRMSELTGMEGTTTTFRLREGRIALVRTGAVEMALEFTPGGASESLYDIGEGALLVRVATRKLELDLGWDGGAFDLDYAVDVENEPLGTISYHIEVKVL